MGNKIIEKKNKNKKIEDEHHEEEKEESEEESIKEIKIKEKKGKDEEDVKRHKSLQLNYLVSNYNGFLDSKNYRYMKTNFKNEAMENVDLPILRRLSNKLNSRVARKSVIHLNNYMPDFPFFHQDEEINVLVSYYVYLKDTLGYSKKQKVSASEYIQDTYIDSSYNQKSYEQYDIEKEKYIIYKYIEIAQKNKGETFGELALQHEDSKRTATIITNTDCILGYLSKSAYQTCLSEIELKRRKNEINFIMSFAIFDKMNWISFENKYFNYFKREYFSQMERIVQQGEKIKKIFFIMSGQFEISTTLSILGIYRIIKQKRKDALNIYKMKVNKNKHKMRLSICNNKDIIGLNDCCFVKPNGEECSFVNVTCISSKSVVFTLDKEILNGLKKKISEINDNIIEIVNKREDVLVDRLITIFNTLIKKREVEIKEKLGILPMKNKSMKNKKENFLGKDSLTKKFKKENKELILKKGKISANMIRLYSANYKQIRPISKTSYFNKNSSNETTIINYSPIKKSTTISSKNGTSKLNSEKINLLNNFGSISINKDSNTRNSISKDYLQKQSFKINEDNKGSIDNLYPHLNKIANNEYKKLSNKFENRTNISQRLKPNYKNEEVQVKLDGFKMNESNGVEEENQNRNNRNQRKNSIKLFENDSLSSINKTNIFVKNKKIENLDRNKEINFFSQDDYNTSNKKYINKSVMKSNNEENKKNSNNYNFSQEKKGFRTRTISNESYLKRILGYKYRDEDDEFISILEKKIMKTIKDYDINLMNITKMRIKFRKKLKKKIK